MRLQRLVYPGSVAAPENLSKEEQRLYRRRASLTLGLFCGCPCFIAAMPRLGELVRQLDARGIGLKRLAEGEVPPSLPAPVSRGGAE
jgi:hypothetical protein